MTISLWASTSQTRQVRPIFEYELLQIMIILQVVFDFIRIIDPIYIEVKSNWIWQIWLIVKIRFLARFSILIRLNPVLTTLFVIFTECPMNHETFRVYKWSLILRFKRSNGTKPIKSKPKSRYERKIDGIRKNFEKFRKSLWKCDTIKFTEQSFYRRSDNFDIFDSDG